MKKRLVIGTRSSELALWQAKHIQTLIHRQGMETELKCIKSDGEIDRTSPLYAMNMQGIFTKALEAALFSKKIDVAVHSLKDIPTLLPKGLTIAATPKRDNPYDVLVYKEGWTPEEEDKRIRTIATSSLRRRAQWLSRFPLHATDVIRGNINTRLSKLKENPRWDGTIFAAAGLDRLALSVEKKWTLDWMVPAPAQGAIAAVCRDDEKELVEALFSFNDEDTMSAVRIERDFLRRLMGGCSMPIGAYAYIEKDKIHFTGNILAIDGRLRSDVYVEAYKDEASTLAELAAKKLIAEGGEAIIEILKKEMP